MMDLLGRRRRGAGMVLMRCGCREGIEEAMCALG